MGVPVIGCQCPVCLSNKVENKRLRTAGVLYVQGKVLAIDLGPDYRTQALRYGIDRIDGILLTHAHYDHIAGLDEVRIYHFRQKISIPCLLSADCFEEVKEKYHYFFPPFRGDASGSRKLDFHILKEDFGSFEFIDIPLRYFTYTQYNMKVLGFRYHNFAYLTDIQKFTPELYDELYDLETLVISALRWEKSPVHFTVDDAIAFSEKVGAKKVYLTHISHDLEHFDCSARLPKHIHMSYDGLEVPIE